LAELHRQIEPNAESLWLGVRIERKIGDRQAENGHASQLRRKFAGTPEHQALLAGEVRVTESAADRDAGFAGSGAMLRMAREARGIASPRWPPRSR
jgi:hypothetical protein